MPDYYKLLGLNSGASLDEIKRAYRLKAKRYHPDINKSSDAKQRFQLLNEAYHALLNGDKRKYYDIKQSFDPEQYRKYGKNYNMHQTGYTDTYKSNSKEAQYQAEADEIDRKIQKFGKKYGEKYFPYFFFLMSIFFIIRGFYDKQDHIMGFIFGPVYFVLGVYILYEMKKISKNRTEGNTDN